MKIFIILLACFLLAVNMSASADILDNDILDTEWKKALVELLVQFPSIFDRLYVEYNYEHGTVPVDAIGRLSYPPPLRVGDTYAVVTDDMYTYYHPFEVNFYDFEEDGIPEAAILCVVPETNLEIELVYKFDGTKYIRMNSSWSVNEGTIEFDCRGIVDYVYYLYEHRIITPSGFISPETGVNNIFIISAMIFSVFIFRKYIKE